MTSPSDPAAPTTLCASCGAPIVCGASNGDTECWCASEPKLVPNAAYPGCLCRDCLRREYAAQTTERPRAPK